MIPTIEEVIAAYNRVKPFVHQTPVLTSTLINNLTETELYFKCENFQKMGAFKMRGAINAIQQLSKSQQKSGVVTHSSGNFAQALSLAAKNLGGKANIVIPSNAPQVKKNAVRDYGGIITESKPTLAAREKEANKIQNKTGATFIHPSNDRNVILGQGTAAVELLKKHTNLDYVVTPVGGGGLIAGTALATHYLNPACKVIGGEPLEADDAWRSLQSGNIETNETASTFADGLRTNLGDKNFPIINKLVPEIIRVEETEIIAAMSLIWERLKIVVEPSSAVALAAVFKKKAYFRNKKIGIIISGGNVDLRNLPF